MYRLESDGIESNFFLSTPLGIVTQNRSGQILSANPAVKNIFGLSPAEMCQLDVNSDLLNAFDETGNIIAKQLLPYNLVFESGNPISGQILAVNNAITQKRLWLSVSAFPLKNVTVDEVYVIFEDISARKHPTVKS